MEIENIKLQEPIQTPLVKQDSIYIKYEGLQKSNSVKYRMVYEKLREAVREGTVFSGVTLMEASAGSTGVALAELGSQMSTPVEIHMYEGSDEKKIQTIKDHGAKIVFYKKEYPFDKILNNINKKNQKNGYWHLNQMHRSSVTKAYEGLAKEVIEQISDEKIERFVCPVGTGGVIQGVGRVLRRIFPNIEVVSLEPLKGQYIDGLRNTEEMYLGDDDPYDREFPDCRIEVPAVGSRQNVQGYCLGDSATAAWKLIQKNSWNSTFMVAAD